jgi:hypothetical protein
VALGEQQKPFGLGVAFGAELSPNLASQIMLCTPEKLAEALEHFLS